MAWRLQFVLLLAATLAAVPVLAPGDADGAGRALHASVAGLDGGTAFEGAYVENRFLRDAPHPHSTIVSTRGAEPSILVDKDNEYIWIGELFGLHWSDDGGATWHVSPNPFRATTVIFDGWALAQDADGVLYASTTVGPTAGVVASTDNGRTWTTVSQVSGQVVAADTVADRPWIAARGSGQLGLVVNGDRGEQCYESADGGLTWLDRSVVNQATPNAGNLVYDSVGRMYFHDTVSLWRWRAPCLEAPGRFPTAPAGPTVFTQVDVDAQDRVYFAQPTVDSSAIVLIGRTGTGAISKTITVSPPELKSNTFATISVRSADEIAVAWYGSETPGDPSVPSYNGAWNAYVTRVKDFWGTPTFTYDRVTLEPNHIGDFCMSGVSCALGSGDRDLADYFMIDYGPDGHLHIAYGHDGAGSNEDVRYASLAPLT